MQKLKDVVRQLEEEVTKFEHENYDTMSKPTDDYIDKVSMLLAQIFEEAKTLNTENFKKIYTKYIKYYKEFSKLENRKGYEFVKLVLKLQLVLDDLIIELEEQEV